MHKPRRLPPINAIRVFEAAARHQSFTRAGTELCMTQAAVSYQIKVLEDRLGFSLFDRKPREVTLTPRGRSLSHATTEAFHILNAAYGDAVAEDEAILTITSLPTFASNWLVPRLGAFQVANPDLAVRLDTSPQVHDLTRDEFDVGIRSGMGDWPGLTAHHMFPVAATPLVPAQAIERISPLERPRDLLKLRLIGPIQWWREWMDDQGETDAALPAHTALDLETQQMEIAAALAGGDAAVMASPVFFVRELESGVLVRPYEAELKSGRSYWMVHDAARRSRKVRVFVDWILSECLPCADA